MEIYDAVLPLNILPILTGVFATSSVEFPSKLKLGKRWTNLAHLAAIDAREQSRIIQQSRLMGITKESMVTRSFLPRFALALPVFLCVHFCAGQSLPPRVQTLQLMEKVCDWQLAHFSTGKSAPPETGWVRTVLYLGDMALYHTSRQMAYYHPMFAIATKNQWRLEQPKTKVNNLADYIAIGQLYAELYFIKPDPRILLDTRQRINQSMADPRRGRDEWWWCDSLFMEPPLLARLSAATSDSRYLDFMDRQWWDSVGFLYDTRYRLMFRDKSYFSKRSPDGSPVFWSRGNGWVLAGTARVLQYMPANYLSRQRYILFFSDLADRIAPLQQPDGFWRANLLDPDAFPQRETSGTGLDCYALAWGINAGILPRNIYLPVVIKAWNALVSCVDPDTGKLGWVQPPGDKPAATTASDSWEYGVGAFLLAGSEMLKLEPSR